jgi:hypothetical protein
MEQYDTALCSSQRRQQQVGERRSSSALHHKQNMSAEISRQGESDWQVVGILLLVAVRQPRNASSCVIIEV